MNIYEKYYKENLYPFQNGILKIVKHSKTPFYLTGGTALSRHYCPVRYSDDLDLFVNSDPHFSDWIEQLYIELMNQSQKEDFVVLTERIQRYDDYTQLYVSRRLGSESEMTLKIDLVNDVAPHYGEIEQDSVYLIMRNGNSWKFGGRKIEE